MKEVTIEHVAAEAGVSIATVSRVVNNPNGVRAETCKKVQEAIRRLGYLPKSKQTHRNDLVLIVLPDIDNPFYTELLNGIEYAASSRATRCILIIEPNVDTNFKGLIQILDSLLPRGLILISPVNSLSVIEALNEHTPLVQCSEYTDNSSCSFVSINNYECSRKAVEHILSKGKTKVALMNGPQNFKYSRERLAAYNDALTAAGLSINPRYIVHLPNVAFDSALICAANLLSCADRPEAIFCTSDIFGAAVSKAASRQGLRIPEDLGLVSFDNTYISNITAPSITAVNQPQFDMGYTAYELLNEKINLPFSNSRQVLMQAELVIKESI